MPPRSLRTFALSSAFALTVSAVAGCGGPSDSATSPLEPTRISVVATTDGQVGTVGAALPTVSVHVTASDGTSLGAIPIAWTVVGAGGAVAKATTETDASGVATNSWTLGLAAGVDSLRASLPNGTGVFVTARATPGTASQLVKVSGDAQSIAAGSASSPLVVRVTDANGNAVKSALVAWVSPSGGGTVSSSSTVTAADGTAQIVLTAPATAGTVVIAASSGQLSPVGFTVVVR